ncbi:hypothetical protein CU320_07905 [Acinetobacter pseudolwoffii]|uniref:Oligosaccharide repeat unit polymerase n=1 Tax=Acinetobacter pseudolwoffii TaxID=2053287 RepID=A0A2H9ULJ4_9GAMM|nr:hypothetical protein CU320_07905 [Acinetobacter pseudolwoffii]
MVYDTFSYLGFQINPNINYFIIFLISLVIGSFSLLLPARIEKPSQLLLLFTYYFIYIPNTVVPYIALNKADDYWVGILSYFTLCFFLLILIVNIKLKKQLKININIRNINYVLIGFILCMFIPVILFYKPNLSNIMNLVSLVDLYEWRDDYREKTKNIPSIVEYMFNWSAKVFVPILLILGLFKSNLRFIFLAFVFNLCLFVVSGHKSIFFSYFLILIFYFVLKRSNTSVSLVFPFISLIFISCFIFFIFKDTTLLSVFVRRMIHIPGMLSGFYYEFFLENGYSKYSYNILKGITFTNYSQTPPYLIGDYYFTKDGINANTGYLTQAYAEYGFCGGISIVLIVGIIYKFMDNLVEYSKSQKNFLILLFIIPTWALINGAFLTVFITHGFLLTMLFIILLKDKFVK